MWFNTFKLLIQKIRETFQITKNFLKTEINHDEVDCNNYKDRKDEWLDFVKQDVLCAAFVYAR